MTQHHTPTPWRAWADGVITSRGLDNSDVVVAQVELGNKSKEQVVAIAQFIVVAANVHEELLAAVVEAESWLASSLSAFNQLPARGNVGRAREILRAAIAKATRKG